MTMSIDEDNNIYDDDDDLDDDGDTSKNMGSITQHLAAYVTS